MPPLRALVIGTGVAGPAVSLALKQAGHLPILFDAAPTLNRGGSGIGLAPNGLRIISALGLLPALEKHAYPIDDTIFRDKHGHVLARTDIGTILRGKYGYTQFGVKRALLAEDTVNANIERGVEVKYGHKLVGIEEGDGSVTALFENGQKATGDILIGCDGLRSTVRKYVIGEEQPPVYTGAVSYYGLSKFPAGTTSAFGTGQNMTFENGWVLGQYLINKLDHEYLWWAAHRDSEPSPEAWQSESTEKLVSRLQELLSSWSPAIHEMLANTTNVIRVGLYDRRASPAWYRSRCVLVGDSAHPTSPAFGQGANMALEDSLVLSRCIEKYPTDYHNAFKTFEAIQKPRTATIVDISRKIGRGEYTSGRVIDWVRKMAIRTMGKDGRFLKIGEDIYSYDASKISIP